METFTIGMTGAQLVNNLNTNFENISYITEEYAYIRYDVLISDYYQVIQTALNNYTRVQIGNDPSQIFTISQPVYLNSNQVLIINGTLKITNAVSSALSADVAEDATQCTVISAAGFSIGQWIIISDDDQPAVGGGAGQTRKMGFCAKITNIISNTIYFDGQAYTFSGTGYEVAKNGIVGTYNSAIICESKSVVTVWGIGTIDGNKVNQLSRGAWNSVGGEEIRGSNGMCFKDCTNIYLKDITAQDWNLHCITTWNTIGIYGLNVSLYRADNKNWLFYGCEDIDIAMSKANEAEYEDGFMLYYGNKRAQFSNCKAIGNARVGFGVNSTNSEVELNNCYAEGYGCNFYVGLSHSVVFNNCIFKDGGYIKHNPTATNSPIEISSSYDVMFNNLIVDGFLQNDEAHYQVAIYGLSYNVMFSGGAFKNTDHITVGNGYGIALYVSDSNTPVKVLVNGVSFHHLKNAFGLVNDSVDRIVFRDCIFHDNTSLGVVRDSAKFYNCIGVTLYETGIVTMPSGSTQVYGSTHVADYVYPDVQRFKLFWLENPGSAKACWVDWTSSSDYPANNFRVNVDVAPGTAVDILWIYDHNIGQ